MLAGSESGGETVAVISSFIANCRRLSVDPFAYLRTVIGKLREDPEAELSMLVPSMVKLDD